MSRKVLNSLLNKLVKKKTLFITGMWTMRKRNEFNIILTFLLVLSSILYGQNEHSKSIDSLQVLLQRTKVDSTKINLLHKISKKYLYNNTKKAIQYAEAALELAQKKKWSKGIAVSYYNLGIIQWTLADYNEGMSYFDRSLLQYESLNDQQGIANCYNNLGLLNVELKKYNQAFNYFNTAYEINQKIDNKRMMVFNLNNIASTYYKQEKYVKSLAYYTKSKNLNLQMNDLNGLAYCYNKIGKIVSHQKEYEKALEYFNKALHNFDKDQDYNLASTYYEIGINYYNMALENRSEKKNLLAISIKNLNKSLTLFSKIGILEMIRENYSALYKSTKELGDYTPALNYFEKYTFLTDSISTNQNKNKITNIEAQQEIDLRDKQIIIQALKIKSDTKKVYLLVLITITVAVLLMLFFWLYISKRNTNFQLKEKNNTIININNQKDKFFSILAHDLRGPFNGFLRLTKLLAADIENMSNEEIRLAAGNMKNSATNLNRLLENLLEWSLMEQGMIPFEPQENVLLEIVEECVLVLKEIANKKEITINTHINKNIIIFADSNILLAILRNLISNALKFTPKGGKISIQVEETNSKTTVAVIDSGIGMSEKMLEDLFRLDVKTNRKGTDDEASTGLGLILCKEFIEKHSGKIWAESEEGKGSTFYFRLPKNKVII